MPVPPLSLAEAAPIRAKTAARALGEPVALEPEVADVGAGELRWNIIRSMLNVAALLSRELSVSVTRTRTVVVPPGNVKDAVCVAGLLGVTVKSGDQLDPPSVENSKANASGSLGV